MSLINQMLRDLEQRDSKPTPAQALNIQVARKSATNTRLWFRIAFLVVIVIGVAWLQIQFNKPAPQPTAENIALQPVQSVESETSVTAKPIEPPPVAAVQAVPTDIQQDAAPEPISTTPRLDLAAPVTAPDKPLPKAKIAKTAAPAPIKTETPVKTTAMKPRLQSLFRQAQDSASLAMRQETLQEVLQLDPEYLPARNLLLQTLIKMRSPVELDRFLEESLRLYPQYLPFVTARAHLLIQRKDFAGAITTLEQVDHLRTDDTDYLSLLAASYQQQKRFESAAEIYRRLTQQQPDKAEHWLGLGICAENLQYKQTAVQAYRQALEKKTLNDTVVDYIKQRLSALN